MVEREVLPDEFAVDNETYYQVWRILEKEAKQHGIRFAELLAKHGGTLYIQNEEGQTLQKLLRDFSSRDEAWSLRKCVKHVTGLYGVAARKAVESYFGAQGWEVSNRGDDWVDLFYSQDRRKRLTFASDCEPNNIVIPNMTAEELETAFAALTNLGEKFAFVKRVVLQQGAVVDPFFLQKEG